MCPTEFNTHLQGELGTIFGDGGLCFNLFVQSAPRTRDQIAGTSTGPCRARRLATLRDTKRVFLKVIKLLGESTALVSQEGLLPNGPGHVRKITMTIESADPMQAGSRGATRAESSVMSRLEGVLLRDFAKRKITHTPAAKERSFSNPVAKP